MVLERKMTQLRLDLKKIGMPQAYFGGKYNPVPLIKAETGENENFQTTRFGEHELGHRARWVAALYSTPEGDQTDIAVCEGNFYRDDIAPYYSSIQADVVRVKGSPETIQGVFCNAGHNVTIRARPLALVTQQLLQKLAR
jgi:hypothetical protein